MADTSGSAGALTFSFPAYQLRTVMRDGEPWFVAADICAALAIQNITQAVARLDDDERAMFNIGRQGDAAIVNESGLYSLILGSRKPEAKRFKRWVTGEVLPAIRRTGRYEAGAAPAGESRMLTSLMGQVGALQAQVAQRDAALASQAQAISGLQSTLVLTLGKQVRLLERVNHLQHRHSRREAVRMAIDMERRGEPRDRIQLATGLNANYLRQIMFRARAAGDLPAGPGLGAHMAQAAGLVPAAQQHLDLGGRHA